jgi:hypothetical protein
MPEIGEADARPLLRSASSRAAVLRADAACTWMKVRAPSPAGFWMAASASSTSWLLLSDPAARRRDISAIDSWPMALPAASGAWASAFGKAESRPTAAAAPAVCCRKVRRLLLLLLMALSPGGWARGSLHSGRGATLAGRYRRCRGQRTSISRSGR